MSGQEGDGVDGPDRPRREGAPSRVGRRGRRGADRPGREAGRQGREESGEGRPPARAPAEDAGGRRAGGEDVLGAEEAEGVREDAPDLTAAHADVTAAETPDGAPAVSGPASAGVGGYGWGVVQSAALPPKGSGSSGVEVPDRDGDRPSSRPSFPGPGGGKTRLTAGEPLVPDGRGQPSLF